MNTSLFIWPSHPAQPDINRTDPDIQTEEKFQRFVPCPGKRQTVPQRSSVVPSRMAHQAELDEWWGVSVENMIGKTIRIAGMDIEIVSDDGERWRCRNITTKEALFMEKAVIESAVKLGKAEVISDLHEHGPGTR